MCLWNARISRPTRCRSSFLRWSRATVPIGGQMTISHYIPGRLFRIMLSISPAVAGRLTGQRPAPTPAQLTPGQLTPGQPTPEQPTPEQPTPPLALLPVLAVAAAVTVVLVAFSGQYGYFRDELYFLTAGQHLAWGYPDQPPLVPFLARLMSDLAPGSLVVLRLPSALGGGALILLTALLTREMRGGRAAQLLACGVIAVAAEIGTMFGLGPEDFDLVFSVLLC